MLFHVAALIDSGDVPSFAEIVMRLCDWALENACVKVPEAE